MFIIDSEQADWPKLGSGGTRVQKKGSQMEAFTPPPYREKRPHGRQPIHTVEMRLMIGKKVSEKEMTYREAAKTFGISGGAVAGCVKLFLNKDKKKNRTANYHIQNDEVASYRHHAQVCM